MQYVNVRIGCLIEMRCIWREWQGTSSPPSSGSGHRAGSLERPVSHRWLRKPATYGRYRHFKTSHPLRVVTVVNSRRHYGLSELTYNLLCLAESVFASPASLFSGTQLAPQFNASSGSCLLPFRPRWNRSLLWLVLNPVDSLPTERAPWLVLNLNHHVSEPEGVMAGFESSTPFPPELIGAAAGNSDPSSARSRHDWDRATKQRHS